MRDEWDVLELPSDPALLTRQLARTVFERPDLLEQEFARLAFAQQQPQHTPSAPAVLEKAPANGV